MSDGDHIRLASITTAVDGSKDGYWTSSLGWEELDCTADLSTQKGERIVALCSSWGLSIKGIGPPGIAYFEMVDT
jgi:hypothetical protein